MRTVNHPSNRTIRCKRRRHKSYVKYFKITTILSLLLIILTCSMIFANPKQVKADDTVYYKYFHYYKVEAGDTLWSIAKKYSVEGHDINEYIKEVTNSNHIKNNKIVEGETLVIPYYLTYIK